MRKVAIILLLLMTTGCVALQPAQQSVNPETDPFQKALEQLLRDNNSGPMKTYIKEHPESVFTADAERLLKLHRNAKQMRDKFKACDKQLGPALQEIKILQKDIDRLTQLNLDMDRSSP